MLCFARQWRVTWRGDGGRAAFKLLLLGSPRRWAAIGRARSRWRKDGLLAGRRAAAAALATREDAGAAMTLLLTGARMARLVSLAARSSLLVVVLRAVSSAGTLLRPICASCGASRARRSAGCKLLSLLNRRARTVLKLSIRPTGCCERRHRHRATLLRETLPCTISAAAPLLFTSSIRAQTRARSRIETRNSTPQHNHAAPPQAHDEQRLRRLAAPPELPERL